MGLEPDDPALLERDRHDPDPCQFQTSRRKRGREGRRGGKRLLLKTLLIPGIIESERICRLKI